MMSVDGESRDVDWISLDHQNDFYVGVVVQVADDGDLRQ